MATWISVNDRLPELTGMTEDYCRRSNLILLHKEDGGVCIGYLRIEVREYDIGRKGRKTQDMVRWVGQNLGGILHVDYWAEIPSADESGKPVEVKSVIKHGFNG